MIEVSGLTKWYGRSRVLDKFDLRVEQGTTVALSGPNGAGKTTVMLCILGLVGYQGSIVVAGQDASRRGKAIRSMIGYVPQLPVFFERLTVRQSLLLSAQLRRLESDRVDQTLELTEISSQRDVRIQALSGGTRQRLALATALLADPPILLLDEPTTNLDAEARQAATELLQRQRAAGRTMILASHNPDEVATLADHVVPMERGRVRTPRTATGEGTEAGLHLALAPDDVGAALEALLAAGHRARGYGNGVAVEVAPGNKAAALAVVTRSGIEIRDVRS